MWWRKRRAKKGRQKRKAAQMVQFILFIISLHPKKSQMSKSICLYNTETWNWSQWPIFFRFSSFSLVRSLWLPQCASIVFMQWTFFAAHQVNENQSTGPAFPRRSHWEKNITSFRAAKNPLLWRRNDLKFNLFCVHLYEKSTMIHLK